MSTSDFHEKPFDDGTLSKLKVFELYTQSWIPVFLSQLTPPFNEVHIFDFFCGPGTDSNGSHGSPLLILNQLRSYHGMDLAGWNKVKIVAHLFDSDQRKVAQLDETLKKGNWGIPNVKLDLKPIKFKDALTVCKSVLENPRATKLLIIDQYGVDEVSDDVFKSLIRFPTTDFIFFISSATLNRFRDHPAIKQKIERPEDSYGVHRAVFDYYKKLVPAGNQVFLGRFSIKKSRNIYGLIFGSAHPLGIHKFLQVAWKNDQLAGEANFDIERENIAPGEMVLPMEEMRPNKIREFEAELESAFNAKKLTSESSLIKFCIEAGMTCQHAAPVIKKMKTEKVIACDFRVPDIRRFKDPRPIRLLSR